MRPPSFWNQQDGGRNWRALALRPLGAIYARLTAARVARAAKLVPDVPVVSVGNLNAGGTGKTPVVIALAMALAATGKRVHVVSRGYGGSLGGPVAVDPSVHSSSEVGDEPLLLAAFCPVWVAKDRALGVSAAQDAGAQVILLDDAHQNPDVGKSLSLLVVDAAVGFGNGCVIPAGPLREPIDAGLARADAVVVIGNDAERQNFAAKWGGRVHCPLLDAQLHVLETGMDWDGLRVFAFAGIGRPTKFFQTLKDLGAHLVGQVALDDHQHVSPALLKRLLSQASENSAQLVTTEKDAVRLPASARGSVLALPVRLDFKDQGAFDALLSAI